MTLAQGLIQIIIGLAPSFIVFVFMMILFSWLRLLIHVMSGKDM